MVNNDFLFDLIVIEIFMFYQCLCIPRTLCDFAGFRPHNDELNEAVKLSCPLTTRHNYITTTRRNNHSLALVVCRLPRLRRCWIKSIIGDMINSPMATTNSANIRSSIHSLLPFPLVAVLACRQTLSCRQSVGLVQPYHDDSKSVTLPHRGGCYRECKCTELNFY